MARRISRRENDEEDPDEEEVEDDDNCRRTASMRLRRSKSNCSRVVHAAMSVKTFDMDVSLLLSALTISSIA